MADGSIDKKAYLCARKKDHQDVIAILSYLQQDRSLHPGRRLCHDSHHGTRVRRQEPLDGEAGVHGHHGRGADNPGHLQRGHGKPHRLQAAGRVGRHRRRTGHRPPLHHRHHADSHVLPQFQGQRVCQQVLLWRTPCRRRPHRRPCFKMAKTAEITWGTGWIPLASCLLIWLMGVSPIWVIIAAGTGGYLWGQYQKRKGKER